MKIEQFVMAYEAEQDRIRAMLPGGFESLRPVLRINTEIRDDREVYIEFNTPVVHDGSRGWLNISNWTGSREEIPFTDENGTVTISAPFLNLSYKGVGIEGGCPAEKDNDGCFFIGESTELHLPEQINANKEFCDCKFKWCFSADDAGGKSTGKTLPAYNTEVKNHYDRQAFTAENAAKIKCEQVLGSYIVRFER